MNERIEYTVVESSVLPFFVGEVNDMIRDGWALQGGVSVSRVENGNKTYVQSMVREKK